MIYRHTKEELESAVQTSLSIAEVCRKLGIVPAGGNYKTLHSKLRQYDISTHHFTGQAWNVGLRRRGTRKKIALTEVLVENSMYNSHQLKNRLIDAGIKERKCESCDLDEWKGRPIPLELDHINGINTDNRLDNLRILCPNCHAQTETYCSKNKRKSAFSERKRVEYLKVREALTNNVDGNPEPSHLDQMEGAETLRDRPTFEIRDCETCGEKFSFNHYGKGKYCSKKCYRKYLRSRIPSDTELIDSFQQFKSYLQVGKHYNVSDNAVRKWCKVRGLTNMVKRKSRPQTSKSAVKTVVV